MLAPMQENGTFASFDPLQQNDPWQNAQRASSPERNPFASASATNANIPPPGLQQSPRAMQDAVEVFRGSEDRNPFTRSEKWMPAFPVPPHDKCTTRPEEVEGFNSYIQNLASWAGLGDNEWPREILWSLRSPTVITWNQMTAAQITRSTRLLSFLKQCFSGHANCCGLLWIRNCSFAVKIILHQDPNRADVL